MIWLYYFLNLILTYVLLLSALSSIFFHIPLAKKLVHKNLINNEVMFIKIQWKRFLIVFGLYLVFIAVSVYSLGIGSLISTAINCLLCIIVGYKKITGNDSLSAESFLSANSKYFKNQEDIANIVLKKTS